MAIFGVAWMLRAASQLGEGASREQMGAEDARPQRGQQAAQGRSRLPAEHLQRGRPGRLRRRRTGDLSGQELLPPGRAVEKDRALAIAPLEGSRPTRCRTTRVACACARISGARQRIFTSRKDTLLRRYGSPLGQPEECQRRKPHGLPSEVTTESTPTPESPAAALVRA
jgi:hypothetical protein